MALEVTGRLVQVLGLQSGTSAKGDWKKQDFVIETEEQYPRKICISLWGDRATDILGFASGDLLTASITVESREFNGKWYTDVRSWRVVKAVPQQPGVAGAAAPQSVAPSPADDEFVNQGESCDDLPF